MSRTRVGIIGAGQLGRMLAEAGEDLCLDFTFLEPKDNISAAGLGPHIRAPYDDEKGLAELAATSDVVTYEFENVPPRAAAWLAERVPVYPPPEALRIAQDRLYEKTYIRGLEIPAPKFRDCYFRDEFDAALEHVGVPAVLKTRRFGYDGKGQRVIRAQEDADAAFEDLSGQPLILEEFVSFDREVSILAARGRRGEFAAWPLVENIHRDGILRLSVAPAPGEELSRKAAEYAAKVMASVDYVGVLAMELFERDGELIFNEMAPRVHNSGHWSIEGSETSQFENHLRAILGKELGKTDVGGHAAMLNLIGDLPAESALDGMANAFFHGYGKSPRPGRKVAHATVVASDETEVATLALEAASRLGDRVLSEVVAERFSS